MLFKLHGVRYNVNVDVVAIALRPDSQRLATNIIDLYTSQQLLHERAVAAGRDEWNDDDVIAEAIDQLAATGDTLALEQPVPIEGLPVPMLSEVPVAEVPADAAPIGQGELAQPAGA
jgi:hypothetical protein